MIGVSVAVFDQQILKSADFIHSEWSGSHAFILLIPHYPYYSVDVIGEGCCEADVISHPCLDRVIKSLLMLSFI